MVFLIDSKSFYLTKASFYRQKLFESTTVDDSRNLKFVGSDGFEPPKATPAELQSAPFGHSGNCPIMKERLLCLAGTNIWLFLLGAKYLKEKVFHF